MKCECCGIELVNDKGYNTIARCRNAQCYEFNVPKEVKGEHK